MFLFALALGAILWQAFRLTPPEPIRQLNAWRAGEQLLPAAVPSWPEENPLLYRGDLSERLRSRSVLWPALEGNGTSEECELFIRFSLHHWVRRPLSRRDLALLAGALERDPLGDFAADSPRLGEEVEVRRGSIVATDLVDDDDGDGDLLDAGELGSGPLGAATVSLCSARG
ncbi:MAG: hypothetical protein AAF481_20090 [Acidobacteriota bacterium]